MAVVGCVVLDVEPELAGSAGGSPAGLDGDPGDPLPDVFESVMSSIQVAMMRDKASWAGLNAVPSSNSIKEAQQPAEAMGSWSPDGTKATVATI